jgi:hypothetical protein
MVTRYTQKCNITPLYCNPSVGKMGTQITLIVPLWISPSIPTMYGTIWLLDNEYCEGHHTLASTAPVIPRSNAVGWPTRVWNVSAARLLKLPICPIYRHLHFPPVGSALFWLKMCPMCRGDLYAEQDRVGNYLACLQFGRSLAFDQIKKARFPTVPIDAISQPEEAPEVSISWSSTPRSRSP